MDLAGLRAQLIQHEGLRLKPYRDTAGKLTIGVGRNLTDVGISEDEAMLLLDHDIAAVVTGLTVKLPWFPALDPMRQRALMDLAFNMGMGGLLQFGDMLSALQRNDYETAADELMDSKWFHQVVTRGPRIVAMLRTGTLQSGTRVV